MAAQLLLLPFTAVAGLIIGLVWGGRTGAEIVIGFHACASTCIFIVWLLEDELTARIVFTKAAIAVPQISVLLFCLLLFLL